jgi:hypothetical protein
MYKHTRWIVDGSLFYFVCDSVRRQLAPSSVGGVLLVRLSLSLKLLPFDWHGRDFQTLALDRCCSSVLYCLLGFYTAATPLLRVSQLSFSAAVVSFVNFSFTHVSSVSLFVDDPLEYIFVFFSFFHDFRWCKSCVPFHDC